MAIMLRYFNLLRFFWVLSQDKVKRIHHYAWQSEKPQLGLPGPSTSVHDWNTKLARNHIHLVWQIYQGPVGDIYIWAG